MKFLVAFALLVVATQATVRPLQSTSITQNLAGIQKVLAAINHPSTNPATTGALEQMILDSLDASKPEAVESYVPIAVGPAVVDSYKPIAVGPAIVDSYEPIAIGPAIVDSYQPVAVGPAIVNPAPIQPSPVVVPNAPLVQIILNIQGQSGDVAVEDVPNPSPVIVVDNTPIVPTPVLDEENALEPAVIGQPILPTPVLSDLLN